MAAYWSSFTEESELPESALDGWAPVEGTDEKPRVGGTQGHLLFTRVRSRPFDQALLGKVDRSPVTGLVTLDNGMGFPDFHIVDLFKRKYLYGTCDQLSRDAYLFRPIPLYYRTWLYHMYYFQRYDYEDPNRSGLIGHALAQSCIDAPVTAGRWSPLACHGPMLLALAMLGDMPLVIWGVAHLGLLCAIALATNTPQLYKLSRLATAPFRLAFLGIVLWRFFILPKLHLPAILGLCFAALLYAVDFIAGDLSQLFNYRYFCSYEIVRSLADQVHLVKRSGAWHLEEDFGVTEPIPEKISGVGKWDSKLMLVADLYGVLTELRPLSTDDWKAIGEDRDAGRRKGWRFAGLDVYRDEAPTVLELDKEQALERQRAALLKTAVRPMLAFGRRPKERRTALYNDAGITGVALLPDGKRDSLDLLMVNL